MKIVLLSRSDAEGGAGQAAYRLFRGLRAGGLDATLKVQKLFRADPEVVSPVSKSKRMLALLWPHLDELPLKCYRSRSKKLWSTALVPSGTASYVRNFAPDIAHLHWINGGLLSTRGIGRLRCPIVWTLHDSWAFTGGCHNHYDCVRYASSCGQCPQLNSHSEYDLSRWLWHHKGRQWRNSEMTIVTPSQWLANAARQSSLLRDKRIEVLPNGLDTGVFKPANKLYARSLLNLPPDKTLILFGAFNAVTDQRKGFAQLQKALRVLAASGVSPDSVGLVVFGAAATGVDLPFPAYFLGTIHDEPLLAAAYSAADVFVLPSLSDNLPCTIMESMACRTPCVAFKVGGIPEMIDHRINGYLATENDAEDLAAGIRYVISSDAERERMSHAAREAACRKYDIRNITKLHVDLYAGVIQSHLEGNRNRQAQTAG